MTSTFSRSRALSLRAPIATEPERALFQRRLALMLLVMFALGFGFWLVTLIWTAIVGSQHLGALLADWSFQIQFVVSVGALVMWLVVRRDKPARNVLDVIDAVTTIALCIGWTVMIVRVEILNAQPESIALLACTYTLVLRAALIPSTPARTALLSAASLAPLVPVTVRLYAGAPPLDGALSPAAYASMWVVIGVVATLTANMP